MVKFIIKRQLLIRALMVGFHYFRLSLYRETTQPRNLGLLTGKLSDAFFEP